MILPISRSRHLRVLFVPVLTVARSNTPHFNKTLDHSLPVPQSISTQQLAWFPYVRSTDTLNIGSKSTKETQNVCYTHESRIASAFPILGMKLTSTTVSPAQQRTWLTLPYPTACRSSTQSAIRQQFALPETFRANYQLRYCSSVAEMFATCSIRAMWIGTLLVLWTSLAATSNLPSLPAIFVCSLWFLKPMTSIKVGAATRLTSLKWPHADLLP